MTKKKEKSTVSKVCRFIYKLCKSKASTKIQLNSEPKVLLCPIFLFSFVYRGFFVSKKTSQVWHCVGNEIDDFLIGEVVFLSL